MLIEKLITSRFWCLIASYPKRRYKITNKGESYKDYIQLHLKSYNCEPNDVEVKVHLDLWYKPRVMEYGWMDTKIAGTTSVLSTEATIDTYRIVVANSLEWLALLVELKKRRCISFNNCMVPFYECLFTRIWLWVPFSGFELFILKPLKVSPSQLRLRSWVFMRVFQLCAKHKSWKPSLRLFLDFFYPKGFS